MSLRIRSIAAAASLAVLALLGCSKPAPPPAEVSMHHHHPPHGGTPVVLGDEQYHLELVLDAPTGTLQAYVLDAEMENFVRCAAPSIEVAATVNGEERILVLSAVANPMTGETVGDTSLFQARAGWLKSAASFDAVIRSIPIRGTTFSGVRFNYPKGNDTDG
jgi:hypothetical protein